MKINAHKYWIRIYILLLIISLSSVIQAQNALILNGGITVLNGGVASNPVYLVVNQPNSSGIVRASGGHIHSENQYNYVKWVAGTNTGNYIFPFGVGGNSSDYIPFTFNKTTAGASDIQLSTWFTDVQNNPKPAATNVGAVTNMTGTADSTLFAIDRFWDIQASATADLTFSYRGIENTTINPNDTVKTQHWNGSAWDNQVGPGNLGVTTGVGTAGPFIGQNTFSPWVLSVVPICPEDTISYSNAVYCNNITTPQTIIHTNGSMVGTYSATPAGLSIDTNTGAINPSLSASGTYTVTFTVLATTICPQFETNTTVTINSIATSTDVQTACNSYTWIDGNTYTSSTNSPTFTIVGGSANGCDSVVTLNLTINNSTTGTDVQTACGNYIWIDGNTYSASTNSPTFTIVGGSANGCDSVVTLNLTINTFASGTDVQTACNSYTWIDGNTYTSSTNSPTFTIVGGSVNGCDSVITLNLTINNTSTSIDVQTACNSFTWIDGNTYSSSTNSPTFTLTNSAGCDSVVTLNLTINNSSASIDVQTACNSYVWIDGNTYTTSTNIPTFTFTNSAGCDSVVTLNLTINPQLSATPNAITPICFNDPISLTATSSGNGTLTWYNDAAGTSIIGTGSPCAPAPTVAAPGTYTYYVNEAGVCSSTLIPIVVVVNGVSAVMGATPNTGFMPLDVVFTNGSTTGVTYTWNFGDGSATSNLFEPNHTYTSLGNYLATLTVTDGICSASTSIVIEVKGESSILIPNVFTPNADGSNDIFTVEGVNLESVEAEIFNRWGLKMYSWNQIGGGWDGRTTTGTEVPDGTYFYVIKAKGIDGTEYFKKGAFSLIR
ncbi:MAG: T9SS type B sorting domain-containing protein [Flavobacteriales bacterium]|nr:MAG: T9SS type B sorting domain-containing protein [Flavobacteriales bacterium]